MFEDKVLAAMEAEAPGAWVRRRATDHLITQIKCPRVGEKAGDFYPRLWGSGTVRVACLHSVPGSGEFVNWRPTVGSHLSGAGDTHQDLWRQLHVPYYVDEPILEPVGGRRRATRKRPPRRAEDGIDLLDARRGGL